ncbi:MAG: NAD(P)-dependent oxidoreductase [Verrucomicrobia bacterium]|nr:NAD(P)-dependent oxidoreductase [Verrucomicrobiota bacterium]
MNILVAGGAGFIGSHIVEELCRKGHRVTVVDGLMLETGGDPANLAHVSGVTLHADPVESCAVLPDLLAGSDAVIDCMGWTRHLLALDNPGYDLELNVASHLALIQSMKAATCRKVLYLGSRGQYGNAVMRVITEDTPQVPVDVQGIHKAAAEAHFRVFAKLTGTSAASLLIGNTFGERLPMSGPDIGLFGGFLRDALAGKEVKLYGKGRTREFTYAPDLAVMVGRLCEADWGGFQAFNIPGTSIELEELIQVLTELAGKGSYSIEDWPAEIKAIDVGGACLCGSKIEALIGSIPRTPLRNSVQAVINSTSQQRHE